MRKRGRPDRAATNCDAPTCRAVPKELRSLMTLLCGCRSAIVEAFEFHLLGYGHFMVEDDGDVVARLMRDLATHVD